MVLSGFLVSPGSLVPLHPLTVPFRRQFEFSVSFLLLLHILVLLFYGYILAGVL